MMNRDPPLTGLETELFGLQPPLNAGEKPRKKGPNAKNLLIAALTAGVVVSSITGCARNKPVNTPTPTPTPTPAGRSADSSQNSGQTVVDTYYTQARSAILQDVPALADPAYKSALDYTAQRIVDMKNVYGLSLDQVRAPITKWVQANVDWDKKGERLIAFNEKDLDFIPLNLTTENVNYDKATRQKNRDTATPARINGTKIPYAAMLSDNIDSIMAGHDQIWAELQNPAKMEEYLDQADIVNIWWAEQEAVEYKSAIRQHGTFADKAHWALVGKAYTKPMDNEELTRNEQPLAYALAVGGDTQIAYNFTVTLSTNGSRGDRQLAIRISKQLQDAINADPTTYGHPIDSRYLQPNLPNRESVDKVLEVSGGKIAMPVVYRGNGSKITWLVGDEPTARKYNLN
ncbi:MAG: hypothetical protein HY516_03750 [Candidatus Aenigmarchaeota archaeon]|nr:hypothetical protein [Candidatus Aenigmarchaeota archaeon]